MGLLVYRDYGAQRELLGRFDFDESDVTFTYDAAFLSTASSEALGLSERLPLREAPYGAHEFAPFFQGLLPEGEILGALAQFYQVPRSDYLHLIGELGCESIGALTFISEGSALSEYEASYRPLPSNLDDAIAANPMRAVVEETSSTRLSLAGAQSKLAWFLPEGKEARSACLSDWLVPYGTAASSHIIKISRKGEELIALNELACSLLSNACGIETSEVSLVDGIPGAIAVKRYDRMFIGDADGRRLSRLHQEDFCQALGLGPFYKYQPEHTDVSYPAFCADMLDGTSANPQADRFEFAKRLLFSYVIGNTDAHLKNFSLLYNEAWTARRLAPLYDATCIPLTGYSTKMPFDVGQHRELKDIDARDLESLVKDIRIGKSELARAAKEVVEGLSDMPSLAGEAEVEGMIDRILDNSRERLLVLKRLI